MKDTSTTNQHDHAQPKDIAHTRIALILDQLSPREIAALYYGTFRMLQDRQELQLSKPRTVTSSQIEIASLHEMQLRDEIEALVTREPQKGQDIAEYLTNSPDMAMRQMGRRLQERLKQKASS